jgi:hypothetical protein
VMLIMRTDLYLLHFYSNCTPPRFYCYTLQFLILWHADPLLGNDRQISNYTTVITGQRPKTETEERCPLCGPCRDVTRRASYLLQLSWLVS